MARKIEGQLRCQKSERETRFSYVLVSLVLRVVEYCYKRRSSTSYRIRQASMSYRECENLLSTYSGVFLTEHYSEGVQLLPVVPSKVYSEYSVALRILIGIRDGTDVRSSY
jgi:hypothetical protein